jgi:DNA-binding NarL/FixJ family response regulator
VRRGRPRENNAAIARELDVSQKTLRNHVSNVLTKLRVVDRPQAIVKAREAGLGIEPVGI